MKEWRNTFQANGSEIAGRPTNIGAVEPGKLADGSGDFTSPSLAFAGADPILSKLVGAEHRCALFICAVSV